jgi:pimeloyl-ACP methyl ester carboxylesterase
VTVPTLILHARGDAMIPFEEGRQLAALVPDSVFVPLEGRNHILLETEPAWARFVQEVTAFIDETASLLPSSGRR